MTLTPRLLLLLTPPAALGSRVPSQVQVRAYSPDSLGALAGGDSGGGGNGGGSADAGSPAGAGSGAVVRLEAAPSAAQPGLFSAAVEGAKTGFLVVEAR